MTQLETQLKARAAKVRSQRAEADRQGRLTESSHRWLVQGGYYKLLVPQEYGGAELPLPDALDIFATACRIDGAFGWNLTIGAGGGVFAAWLPDETATEIYAPAEALIAGSGAPQGRREQCDGGFRVSGRWAYASGIHHATWVTANTIDEKDDSILAVAVPADQARIESAWEVGALRATGSDTVILDDVFVPETHTFDLAAPSRISRSLYRFPFLSLAEASFAAAIVGCARGALDRFLAGPIHRTVGGSPASEHEAVRSRVALVQMDLCSAWSYLSESVDALWQAAESANEPVRDPTLQLDLSLAAVHAARRSLTAVDTLAEMGGMAILQRTDALGLAIGDTRAMAQHVMLSPLRSAELGGALLAGLDS